MGSVVFGCHQLIERGARDWVLVDPESGDEVELQVSGRDEWSVYFFGAGIDVRIDYHLKEAYVNWQKDVLGTIEKFPLSGADYSRISQNHFSWKPEHVRPDHVNRCVYKPV